MNQQSIPEIQGQELSTQAEESGLSFRHKNSLQLKRWQIVAASLILLAAGIGIGRYQPSKGNSQIATSVKAKPLPVETQQITLATKYQTQQNYTGEVVAMRSSEVGFERGGKLVDILVDEGERVSQGDTIARLDTSNLEAQRRALTAQKKQAQAKLAELQNGARSERIAAASAQVRDLERQLELEKIKRDRREYLFAEGAIAKEQLDELNFNSQALQERLSNARSNLAELANGTRSEQITAQQAVVEQLSAQIADLDINIAKSTLKAPFSGTIALRNYDEGTVIETGRAIVRLIEDSQPEVKIGLPIDLVSNLQLNSKQSVVIGGKNYSAKVKAILPEVDVATRTRTVILQLPPTAKVFPQQIARLSVRQINDTAGYWLPITALVKNSQGNATRERGLWSCYAVIADENNGYKIDRRLIEILETAGDRVLVRGTIETGDAIVTNGTQRLVPGQFVSI